MDKISVVIPVYKVEPYLRQCLDSITGQTYKELEIILVDDGSPDTCGAICDEYAERDGRITVIHKENGGLSAARNDGLERATGEWVAFVDSDDWCEETYYERLLSALAGRRADIVIAGGGIFEYDNRREIRHTVKRDFIYTADTRRKHLTMAKVLAAKVEDDDLAGEFSFGAPWDKLYRTSFLREHGLRFDSTSRAWEDVWFNFQTIDKAGVIVGCTCIGYHYRMVMTSITKGFNPDKPEINYGFAAKLRAYMKGHVPDEQLDQAINVRTLAVIRNSFKCCYFHQNNGRSMREIAKEIGEINKRPCYREAIYAPSNRWLTRRQICVKYLLRLRSGWPVTIMYRLKQKIK